MTKRFNIVFDGQLAQGQSAEQVKQALAALFKRNPADIEPLFGGKRVVLKRNVDLNSAHRYANALLRAGAVCRLESVPLAQQEPSLQKPIPLSPAVDPLSKAQANQKCPCCGSIRDENTAFLTRDRRRKDYLPSG